MHRLVRALAVLVTAMLLFGGLRVQPTFAQSANNGLTGDNSYESPTFGYTVEWQDPWYALEDQTSVSDTGDTLALFSDEYGARTDIYSFFANGRTVQEFADSYLAFLQENHTDVEVQEDVTGTKTNPAYLVSFSLDSGTVIDDYFEVQEAGDALVLTEIRGAQGMGIILAAAVSIDITLNGDPILGSFASSETPTPEPTEESNTGNSGNSKTDRPTTRDTKSGNSNLETYESPTFGSTFQYDPEVWTVSDELTADKNNGRDSIILESEDLPARVYVENYDDYDGKAAACIDVAAGEAVGDLDQADLLQDENGDDLQGSSKGKTWVAYAFESSSGDALAAYIECRSLPKAAGVLVFTLITTEDAFPDAYAAGLDILDTVSVDGSTADSGSTSKTDTGNSKTDTGNSKTDSGNSKTDSGNTTNASGSYESPSFGYVLNYDSADWEELDSGTTQSGADQLTLSGPDNATVLVQGMAAGRGATAEVCVENYANAYQETVADDLAPVNDRNDEPFVGTDSFGYYALYSYTDKNGDTQALFLECGPSPDEDVFVLFVSVAPVGDLEAMLNNISDLMGGLEF